MDIPVPYCPLFAYQPKHTVFQPAQRHVHIPPLFFPARQPAQFTPFPGRMLPRLNENPETHGLGGGRPPTPTSLREGEMHSMFSCIFAHVFFLFKKNFPQKCAKCSFFGGKLETNVLQLVQKCKKKTRCAFLRPGKCNPPSRVPASAVEAATKLVVCAGLRAPDGSAAMEDVVALLLPESLSRPTAQSSGSGNPAGIGWIGEEGGRPHFPTRAVQ